MKFMKNLLLLFIIVLTGTICHAQNATYGTTTDFGEINFGPTNWNGGSPNTLGLYTTTSNPNSPYSVRIGGDKTIFASETFNGNSNLIGPGAQEVYVPGKLRIGTNNTAWDGWKLRIDTDPTNAPYLNGMLINIANTSPWSYGFLMRVNNNNTKAFVIENTTLPAGASQNVFSIYGSGEVYATGLEIRLAGNIPDYVFEEDYNLMSLKDLDAYIDNNGHLPGVPSAEEYEEIGKVNVGKLQLVLLEKIEELTLYVLQLKDENKVLRSDIVELQKTK